MMMLQTMIVKNGLIRINDQYPRSPRQTIRVTKSTSSSFDALSLRDRSSSFTGAGLFGSNKGHSRNVERLSGARAHGWVPLMGIDLMLHSTVLNAPFARDRSQALPEECSSMARAPVSKFGSGHPAAFYRVPLSQYFRA
jgi:hypothetical protein